MCVFMCRVCVCVLLCVQVTNTHTHALTCDFDLCLSSWTHAPELK